MLQTMIKTVGINGQISLGKSYAGKKVLIEEQEPGVLLIRTAQVIPDNEAWLHQPAVAAPLHAAMVWAAEHPAQESDLEALANALSAQEHG